MTSSRSIGPAAISLRELFLIVSIFAVMAGWFVDKRAMRDRNAALTTELKSAQLRLHQAEDELEEVGRILQHTVDTLARGRVPEW
jgi:hypothetical protein